MGLRPTHGDESALLTLDDSKQVTRDFRGSVIVITSTMRTREAARFETGRCCYRISTP
jgi:hypothetical protein